MATVKIVLRKKQNKNGEFPLAIRITKDRKTSFIHLGQYLKSNEWDSLAQRVKKNHSNSTRLNNFLIKKLGEANDTSLELETQKKDFSSIAVKNKIKPAVGTSFFAQADLYLDNLKKRGKYNQYTADNSRLKNFKGFLQQRDIYFTDVTVSLLEKLKIYLKSNFEISERTIINHMVVIRSVFSQAVKAEIVDRKYYPFGAGKITIRFPDSIKIGLTVQEVKKIEELELPLGSLQNHARNLWLFSFYLAGMRVSDVFRLRWNDIQDNRLYYAMGKNAKGGSLKLPQKASEILQQYEDLKRYNDDFIFPELKKYYDNTNDIFAQNKSIGFATSRTDKVLRKQIAEKAEIDKKITMHIARHTFGNISGDTMPIQMLQKLYRHSSVTTTIGYQSNFIHRDADLALDSVVNF